MANPAPIFEFNDQQIAFAIEWLRNNAIIFDMSNQDMWRSLIVALREHFQLVENFVVVEDMPRAYRNQIDPRLNEYFGTSIWEIDDVHEEEIEDAADWEYVNLRYSERFQYIRSVRNYDQLKEISAQWIGIEIGQVPVRNIKIQEEADCGAFPLAVNQCRKANWSLFRGLHFVVLKDPIDVVDVLFANAVRNMIMFHGGQCHSWYNTCPHQQENLRRTILQDQNRLIFVRSQFDSINLNFQEQYPMFPLIEDQVLKNAIRSGQTINYEHLLHSESWERAPRIASN